MILPLIGLLMPFGIFWMRAHFRQRRAGVDGGGQLDGASQWQTFRRIHLPLATPAWSALAVLFFLATWNQYLLPLVLVDDPIEAHRGRRPRRLPGPVRHRHVLLCAGSLLIIAPSLVIYLVFQRNFVGPCCKGR